MKKGTVLIVVHTNSWFAEMLRLAQLILRDGTYEPVIQFAYSHTTVRRDMQILKENGVNYVQNPDISSLGLKALKGLLKLLRAPPFKIVAPVFTPVFETWREFVFTLLEIRYFRRTIRNKSAVMTVMAGDLVGYNCSELARASKVEGIPCIVIPSMISGPIDQASAYFANPDFSCDRPLNALVAKIWPKWKFEYRGKSLVRLPAEKVLVREALSLAPPLPWVFCSTIADAVAVESPAMMRHYRRFGLSEHKLKLTGSPTNDALYTSSLSYRRSDLLNEFAWDQGRKVILTALPPDTLYMPGGKPDCEFKTYPELVKFWIDSLKNLNNAYTVVSLHPSVDKEDFEYLESSNLKISSRPIVDLIPSADFFVASVSSTIRWALASSKPVLNYDVYRYGYEEFKNVPGVILAESKTDFVQQLKLLTEDPNYLFQQNESAMSSARDWGQVDGSEGNRVLQFLSEQISKSKRGIDGIIK